MKTIKYINTFAISLPIILALIGIIINDTTGNYFGYALFSTMLTGFLQVMLGLTLFFTNTNNKPITIYLSAVVLFFLLWYLNTNFIDYDVLNYCLFAAPPILAVYLSLIIYKKEKL
ncbi:hypothetical protein ACI6PS_12825 [Flavobacterium sp. PLA-1-15]|uniref:hypothetical protein n=1 Tax=Flavobacterium sp. PLA-1-15 TaxID=3380533 RepID=UPI003B79A19C